MLSYIPSNHVLCAFDYATAHSLELRLEEGDSKYEGRLEVYYNGSWGTVCEEGFGMEEAFVVCRQLFSTFPANYKFGSFFGRGTGPVVLDDLRCSGNETHLQDCLHRGLGEHRSQCNNENEAGVVCLGKSMCPV